MWNGIFKSYSVVKVIPITKMRSEDWRILEFEGLRNKAKNRIAESVGEDFVGFVQVHVFEKGIGKPHYYMPATEAVVAEIKSGKWKFLNEPDDDALHPNAVLLGDAQEKFEPAIKSLSASGFARILAAYAGAKWAKQEKLQKDLEELEKLWDSDDPNDLDAGLAIALELAKHKDFKFLDSAIDEVDEYLGWADEVGLL